MLTQIFSKLLLLFLFLFNSIFFVKGPDLICNKMNSSSTSTIPTTDLQVILNYLDFGMDVQEAVNASKFHHQWLPDQIDYELFGFIKDIIVNIQQKRQLIEIERTLGRVVTIAIEDNIYTNATNPRGFKAATGY